MIHVHSLAMCSHRNYSITVLSQSLGQDCWGKANQLWAVKLPCLLSVGSWTIYPSRTGYSSYSIRIHSCDRSLNVPTLQHLAKCGDMKLIHHPLTSILGMFLKNRIRISQLFIIIILSSNNSSSMINHSPIQSKLNSQN